MVIAPLHQQPDKIPRCSVHIFGSQGWDWSMVFFPDRICSRGPKRADRALLLRQGRHGTTGRTMWSWWDKSQIFRQKKEEWPMLLEIQFKDFRDVEYFANPGFSWFKQVLSLWWFCQVANVSHFPSMYRSLTHHPSFPHSRSVSPAPPRSIIVPCASWGADSRKVIPCLMVMTWGRFINVGKTMP